MDQAYEFCEVRVREADKDRFVATLFAPEAYRGPLYALHAFDADIVQVRDRIMTPLPGEVRLQWWRDALTGTAQGDTMANPVAAALLETVQRFALPKPSLLDLIDAHTFDLYDEPMATIGELERYAAATSAALIRLAAQVLSDGTDPGYNDAARHAGIACCVTAVLQRFAIHTARGQSFVPRDILTRHGAVAEPSGGRGSPSLLAALAELRQVARLHLAVLDDDLPRLPDAILPAFLPVALTPRILRSMESARYDPYRPPVVAQWRRQWALWRAARDPRRISRG
ncbi:MAG: phytoene/squalene synthase family protein [Rhizobiales bacterium]|nr:phytoene/squalene synthase family protein [Hyphomicrobiales bacterium]